MISFALIIIFLKFRHLKVWPYCKLKLLWTTILLKFASNESRKYEYGHLSVWIDEECSLFVQFLQKLTIPKQKSSARSVLVLSMWSSWKCMYSPVHFSCPGVDREWPPPADLWLSTRTRDGSDAIFKLIILCLSEIYRVASIFCSCWVAHGVKCYKKTLYCQYKKIINLIFW